MYYGSITLINDFNKPETNPRARCRAKFLGGEFYIDQVEHSWKYGDKPTIKLSISRGMVYDKGGNMGDPINNVGKQFLEIEKVS